MIETKFDYKYTIISSINEFEQKREYWELLFSKSINKHLFLQYAWLVSWWKIFSSEIDEFYVVLIEKNSEPYAAAPFFIRKKLYYGLSRRVLSFIGEGNSDRCDILIKEYNIKIFDDLITFLYDQKNWEVISLREIPQNSPFLYWANENKICKIEKDSICPYIDFDKNLTIERYNENISKKTKREFRNLNNRLKELGSYKCNIQKFDKNFDEILENLKEIEAKSAKADRKVYLVFNPAINLEFQKLLLHEFEEKTYVLLTTLEINNTIIAYLYGFVFEGVYHAYNTAFLPEYSRLSPGKIVIQDTIYFLIANDHIKFDFLRGDSYLKSRFSDKKTNQYHVTIIKKTIINKLHEFLIFKIRPKIKNTLIRLNIYSLK